MSTDAITVLKQDHKEVARLFREFEASKTTPARKRAIVTRCLELLTVHTFIENEVMYPEVRARVPELDQHILESYEEHHVVDLLAAELSAMPSDDERYFPKFTVLMENVRHHVQEEEDEWFPTVRDSLSRTELREIGARMLALKPTAPTTPQQPSRLAKVIDAVTP